MGGTKLKLEAELRLVGGTKLEALNDTTRKITLPLGGSDAVAAGAGMVCEPSPGSRARLARLPLSPKLVWGRGEPGFQNLLWPFV